jgi:hypothetical protein
MATRLLEGRSFASGLANAARAICFVLLLIAVCLLGLVDTPLAAASVPATTINGGSVSNQPAEIAAGTTILAALISVVSTLLNEWRRRAHDREMGEFNAAEKERLLDLKRESDLELAKRSAELKAKSDLQLAQFNGLLTEQLSPEAARRTYEYEARKKLYHECEPLLFQLSQNARVAIGRIISLARNAREGQLDGTDGALSGDLREASDRGYYFRSTLYQLLAPLGVCYILQTHLTFQDTSLDPWINRQFLLYEAAYKAFTRDFFFAGLTPTIDGYRETADRRTCRRAP